MEDQNSLFADNGNINQNEFHLGKGLVIGIKEDYPRRAVLHRNGVVIKRVNLSDKISKKLFVTEAPEHGAMKSRLAEALGISRQTIDNYQGTMKNFGLEGLVQGYTRSDSKSRQIQRRLHAGNDKRVPGSKAKLLEQIRREAREKCSKEEHEQLLFKFGYDSEAVALSPKDQPFSGEHEWEASRYAGVTMWLIPLITEWKWLKLITGYFHSGYKIFMVFLLMSVRGIRSIEQIKNVRLREAGRALGTDRLPGRPKLWEWFYEVSDKRLSLSLLNDYFRYQICSGLVGVYLWFTDGHLLPYTGKNRVHYSYNTQRRMPVPGRTNMVTCDERGRIVDFEIQEGKGNLKDYITELNRKRNDDLPGSPVMVFDREGYDAAFFSRLVINGIPFVTWEKNPDTKKLSAVDEEKFTEHTEFNNKSYSFFEDEKVITYCPPEDEDVYEHCFKLRRIYIWNKSSRRRTCALAWSGEIQMSTCDCAVAILSRWGASENTFKHINNRHPLHYHPGFRLSESENQEIRNPELKRIGNQIINFKNRLNKLYKKLSGSKNVLNKDGSPRRNSAREKLKNMIQSHEAELEALKEEKKNIPEKVDVSSLEDYKSFRKIDNEGKNLFDFVTTSAWNARELMIGLLRSSGGQKNEVVDLFYAISDCHGWIKNTKYEVIVRLEPLQQHSRRMAQEELCRKLTAMGAQLPNGKWIQIEVGESPL